jgi:hypothetical protein
MFQPVNRTESKPAPGHFIFRGLHFCRGNPSMATDPDRNPIVYHDQTHLRLLWQTFYGRQPDGGGQFHLSELRVKKHAVAA